MPLLLSCEAPAQGPHRFEYAGHGLGFFRLSELAQRFLLSGRQPMPLLKRGIAQKLLPQ